MRARFIPVPAGAHDALADLGLSLPADGEQALLGLPSDGPPVEGTEVLHLEAAPHLCWWAGPRGRLISWCRAHDVAPDPLWPTVWRLPSGPLTFFRRGAVMGVLNVTPDSFSDGARYQTAADQASRVGELLEEGALLVDVGGESTRPGHVPVSPDLEWARLEPLLETLAPAVVPRLSVDTRHGATAARAARIGVSVINDVSGHPDPAMTRLLAEGSIGYVYMYNRPAPFPANTFKLSIMLGEMDRALAGLASHLPDHLLRVAVDPGIGFAYGVQDNLTVLSAIGLFRVFDRPLLTGASRKRFLGHITGRPVGERDAAGTALSAILRQRGVDLLRTHRVKDTVDALRVAEDVS